VSTTRERFFGVLKDIRDILSRTQAISAHRTSVSIDTALIETLLTALGVNTDGLESQITSVIGFIDGLEALVTSVRDRLDGWESDVILISGLNTSVNNIESDADVIRTELIDLNTSTDNIETDINSMRINIATMTTDLDDFRDKFNILGTMGLLIISLEATLLLINTSLNFSGRDVAEIMDAVDLNTNGLEANTTPLLRQFNLSYGLVSDYDVTGIGGGTVVDVRILVAAGQLLFIEDISFITTGGANTIVVTENLTGTVRQIKVLGPSAPTTAGAHVHVMFRNAATVLRFAGDGFTLKGGHEIRFVFSGVAVADRLFIQIGGRARTSTLPTIDTSNSTATITPTTDEHNID